MSLDSADCPNCGRPTSFFLAVDATDPDADQATRTYAVNWECLNCGFNFRTEEGLEDQTT